GQAPGEGNRRNSGNRGHPRFLASVVASAQGSSVAASTRLSSHLFPIWLVIVGSVIFLSSASRNALLRMIESVLSPSNGRNTLSADLFVEPRPGTMHRYWSLGDMRMLPEPRRILYVRRSPWTTRYLSASVQRLAILSRGMSVSSRTLRVWAVADRSPNA